MDALGAMALVYGVPAVVLGGLAVALYCRARASRRRYRCPNCGEVFDVELMAASRCNVCGTPVADGAGARPTNRP